MRLASLVLLCFVAGPIAAQDAQSDLFRDRLKDVPQLPMDRIQVKVGPSLVLEGISAVSVDEQGNVYVLHRPTAGDPVVVLDPMGHFLRSWGAGMFNIPHGIRIDPVGNVWTVDSNTSKVYKFTPEGALLLEIQIELPESGRGFHER